MSTTSSVPKPVLGKGLSICDWKIIRKLGCGGFGSVYEVEKDGLRAAMKAEFISNDRSESLRNEVQILRLMQWSSHFCHLYLACKLEGLEDKKHMNIMIMTLVGRPLSRMRRMTPNQKFTKSTAIRVSKQCLQALEDLHSTGVLHRDVKGSNFAWSDENKVYLLDLGFARKYLELKDGRMSYRAPRKKAPFLGTAKYCSINVHNRLEQGRRDDLWAWLYMTVEFLVGRLLWRNMSDKNAALKKSSIGSSLLNKCPRELYVVYDHIRSLQRESKPNYDLLQRQLDKICARYLILPNDPLDWQIGGAFYEHFTGRSDTEKDLTVCEDPSEHEKKSNSEALEAPSLPVIEVETSDFISTTEGTESVSSN